MATMSPGVEPTLAAPHPSHNGVQLPDEAVDYSYAHSLVPPADAWTPLAELQSTHLIARPRLHALAPTVMSLRGQILAEREIVEPRPEQKPLLAGFIDLPQRLLDNFRRKGDASEVGRVLSVAGRLREEADRVVVLGSGGPVLGARALLEALLPAHHNEMPMAARLGKPRCYFPPAAFDADSAQDLFEMLENTCIDPELREERWGVVAVSKSGDDLETTAALRAFRAEAARFYGSQSPRLKRVMATVTGPTSPLRDLCRADGHSDEEILTIPDNVGAAYSVLTPAGLLPAALVGLDVRAILLGAAAVTRRFVEEPFERNPVLQLAAVNYLMHSELHNFARIVAVWSPKLEALGRWYDHLVADSLGKHGKGPTPMTAVMPRDLHVLGQLLHDGPRDKFITHLAVRSPRTPPPTIGMADRNEDGLNAISRKTAVDLQTASHQALTQSLRDSARPGADLTLPTLAEHALGQAMQMLMLAAVVEARLMGVNPYAEPGLRGYRAHLKANLGLS